MIDAPSVERILSDANATEALFPPVRPYKSSYKVNYGDDCKHFDDKYNSRRKESNEKQDQMWEERIQRQNERFEACRRQNKERHEQWKQQMHDRNAAYSRALESYQKTTDPVEKANLKTIMDMNIGPW